MIVVDFNQTAISNLMMEVGGRNDIEIQVPLLRHMILNSIRSYKKKFGKEYGELVINGSVSLDFIFFGTSP